MSTTGGPGWRVVEGVALPREPKQERSRRKQERLLEAAEDLFATRGFDAVTADDIAAHAGYGTGTFYNYFANKVQVFLVVASRHETAIAPALEGVVAAFRAGADLRGAVAATVGGILEVRLRVPWLRRTWVRLGLTSPDVAAVQARIDADWDAAMAEVLERGVAAGALRAVDPAGMATALRVLVDALCDEAVLRGTLEPDAAVAAATDLILGLVPGAPR